jgi:hypothetical protein
MAQPRTAADVSGRGAGAAMVDRTSMVFWVICFV